MRYTQKRFSVMMPGEKATWPIKAEIKCIKCVNDKNDETKRSNRYYLVRGWWLCEACKREYDGA